MLQPYGTYDNLPINNGSGGQLGEWWIEAFKTWTSDKDLQSKDDYDSNQMGFKLNINRGIYIDLWALGLSIYYVFLLIKSLKTLEAIIFSFADNK